MASVPEKPVRYLPNICSSALRHEFLCLPGCCCTVCRLWHRILPFSAALERRCDLLGVHWQDGLGKGECGKCSTASCSCEVRADPHLLFCCSGCCFKAQRKRPMRPPCVLSSTRAHSYTRTVRVLAHVCVHICMPTHALLHVHMHLVCICARLSSL